MTKAFLIAVAIPPLMMVIVSTIMPMLMNKAAPRVEGHIAIIDRSGLVATRVEKAFEHDEVVKRRAEAVERGMNKRPLPPETQGTGGRPGQDDGYPGALNCNVTVPQAGHGGGGGEVRRSWPPRAWRRMRTGPTRAWR